MVNKAYAGAREIKDYMRDRVNAVYGADKTFPKRASQDNAQVKALYDSWLSKPLGHKSEELHSHQMVRQIGRPQEAYGFRRVPQSSPQGFRGQRLSV